MSIATGWFGIPGSTRSTKTHIVQDGKPICGAPISPLALFQQCTQGASPDVECRNCGKLWYKRLREAN